MACQSATGSVGTSHPRQREPSRAQSRVIFSDVAALQPPETIIRDIDPSLQSARAWNLAALRAARDKINRGPAR